VEQTFVSAKPQKIDTWHSELDTASDLLINLVFWKTRNKKKNKMATALEVIILVIPTLIIVGAVAFFIWDRWSNR
jgi:hypothetical protein